MQHRFRNKEIESNFEPKEELGDAYNIIQARRERSLASSAAAHWAEWRARCTRVGSRWMPNPEQYEDDGAYEDSSNEEIDVPLDGNA
jgi:hypothetical protein